VSPRGTPKKGVTKIGHMAETRIITGRIGLSLEFAKISLETLYYQPNTHFIVNQKQNENSRDKCRIQNHLYNFISRIQTFLFSLKRITHKDFGEFNLFLLAYQQFTGKSKNTVFIVSVQTIGSPGTINFIPSNRGHSILLL
jgi:hypothetical protein